MARYDQEAPAQARRIGRYEVLGEIASGGMATVYLSRSIGAKGFSRLVAIKRLHPHLEAEDDFVQMFLDEARLAARIRHPNVVATLDVEDSEGLYIVMEYIEGVTLLMLWRQAAKLGERMPVPVAARIILDTLGGLHAAHELLDDNGDFLSLIHRDVSPQNILLGVDGVSRITDFGIAKASSRLTMTRDGQLKGKISYMAPEQTKRVEIDRRVDLFAMGIVAWEVLAGKRLFSGESDVEVLNQLLFEPIPRLKDHAPSVPSGLEQVVMRALDRDPQQRWSTAHEFADGIERAMKPLGGPANHRTVATYIQKVAGERIAREKGRIANGAPPTDGNTTGSFKALDGPPVTPSRVRSAPPGTRPPQPAIPQRPTTPAPGAMHPQRPTTPAPGGMPPPGRPRPPTLAPSASPGIRAPLPARAPLPPPPQAAPQTETPAARRPARSTMMGIGDSPALAPSAPTPRKPVALTYEEEFDEEMPTIQAAVSPIPSGVRPAASPPRSATGFAPQAPLAPPTRPAERVHKPTVTGPAFSEPKSAGLPSFALPPDPVDDPSMAPRPALDPWASPAAVSPAPLVQSAGYDTPEAAAQTMPLPRRPSGLQPAVTPPAQPAEAPLPPEVAPLPPSGDGYSMGRPSEQDGASGYSLGSRPPPAVLAMHVSAPEPGSRRAVMVALGIVILGAVVAGAIVMRGNTASPAPSASSPVQTSAAPTTPATPEAAPAAPVAPVVPPVAAAPTEAPPVAAPEAPSAPPTPPETAPVPAAAAAPPVAPAPVAAAPVVAAPVVAPPAAAPAAAPERPATGHGGRGRRRHREDDDPTARVGVPAAVTTVAPRAPVAAPAPTPAPRPARPRNNQPDPDAPDLGDPYR